MKVLNNNFEMKEAINEIYFPFHDKVFAKFPGFFTFIKVVLYLHYCLIPIRNLSR